MEFHRHLHNSHGEMDESLVVLLKDHNFDVEAAHASLHASDEIITSHDHGPDGEVVSEGRDVLEGKRVQRSQDGWIFPGSDVQVLSEFSELVETRNVRLKVESRRTDGVGPLEAVIVVDGDITYKFTADSFVEILAMMIGRTYLRLEKVKQRAAEVAASDAAAKAVRGDPDAPNI